jgi:hypothetical protein
MTMFLPPVKRWIFLPMRNKNAMTAQVLFMTLLLNNAKSAIPLRNI